jgi:hypothetical protein
MSLLNKASDGLASVLIALHRTLSIYGPQSEDDLIAIVAPPNMLDGAKPDMVRKTLTRWQLLGFFEIDAENKTRLAASIPPSSTSNEDDLRAAILELILRERNNAGFLPPETDDDEKEERFSDASDLTRAASWMLAQDPYTFPDALDEAERLQSEQRFKSAFVNITRWSGFREWAVFLGLASTPGGRIVPNPAIAVRTALFESLGGLGESPINSLVDDLGSSLPVLDGGRYRLEVQTQMGNPWREQLPHEISPSLSVAFLTLDASKEIRLDSRSDAPQRTLLGPRGTPLRQVSHIVDLRSKA